MSDKEIPGHLEHSPLESRDPKGSKEAVSFVIVLRLEPRELPGEPEWRWRVTRVQTGEQTYFHRIGDLLAYVSAQAGVPPPH